MFEAISIWPATWRQNSSWRRADRRDRTNLADAFVYRHHHDKRNTPIAEIRPLPVASAKPRPLGIGKGKVRIHPRYFEPLPDDLLDLFEGKGR